MEGDDPQDQTGRKLFSSTYKGEKHSSYENGASPKVRTSETWGGRNKPSSGQNYSEPSPLRIKSRPNARGNHFSPELRSPGSHFAFGSPLVGTIDPAATRYFTDKFEMTSLQSQLAEDKQNEGKMPRLDMPSSAAKSYLHESTMEGTSLVHALDYLLQGKGEEREELLQIAERVERGLKTKGDRFVELQRKKRTLSLAPRHHIPRFRESVKTCDYYDMVVVANVRKKKMKEIRAMNAAGDTVPEDKIVQLSLEGVLNLADDELLTIPQFLREKQKRNTICKLTFFGKFRETKIFRAWRDLTWQRRFRRRSRSLLRQSWMAYPPVVELMLKLRGAVLKAEDKGKLYAFSDKNGVWGAESFLSAQLAKIRRSSDLLHEEVDDMASTTILALDDILATQYSFGTNKDRMFSLTLADEPLSTLDRTRVQHEQMRDWRTKGNGEELGTMVDRRGAESLRAGVSSKVQLVLNIVHMMMKHVVAMNIAHFFVMFKQSIRGVRHVNVDLTVGPLGMWNYEEAQKQGDLVRDLADAAEEALRIKEAQSHMTTEDLENGVGSGGHISPAEVDGTSADRNAPPPDSAQDGDTAAADDNEASFDDDNERHDDQEDGVEQSGVYAEKSLERRGEDMKLSAQVTQAYLNEGFHMGLEVLMHLDEDTLPVQFDLHEYRRHYGSHDIHDLHARLSPSLPRFLGLQDGIFAGLAELISNMPVLPKHDLLVSAVESEMRRKEVAWIRRLQASRDAEILDAGEELPEGESGAARLHELLEKDCMLNGFVPTPTYQSVRNPKLLQGIRYTLDECQTELRMSYAGALMSTTRQMDNITSVFRSALVVDADIYLGQLQLRPCQEMLRVLLDTAIADGILDAAANELIRTSQFVGKVVFLEHLVGFDKDYPFVKADPGLVISFAPIIQQVKALSQTQAVSMFCSVPTALKTMCEKYEKLAFFLADQFKVEGFKASRRKDAENELPYDTLVKLMKLLVSFEAGRKLLDAESQAVNEVYRVFKHYYVDDRDYVNYMTSSAAAAERRIARVLLSDEAPKNMLSRFDKSYDKLAATLLQTRIFLAKGLKFLRTETLSRKKKLEKEVEELHETLLEPRFMDTGANAASLSDFLRRFEEPLADLRRRREELVATMLPMLDITDHVESIELALAANEMDTIPSLDVVASLHEDLRAGWGSVVRLAQIQQKLNESTLRKVQVSELRTDVESVSATCSALFSKIGKAGPVILLRRLLQSITPKLSVVSYLKAYCLLERHWQRMIHLVFRPLRIKVEMKGKSPHFTSSSSQTSIHIKDVPLTELFRKGIASSNSVETICGITTDAAMESVVMNIMSSATKALMTPTLELDVKWIKDLHVRAALDNVEVRELINAVPLLRVVSESERAITIAEQCLRIMLIDSLKPNTDALLNNIHRVNHLLQGLVYVHRRWRDTLDFVLFAATDEYDKDAKFMFQTCTDALCQIDRTFSEASGNMLKAEALLTQKTLSIDKVRTDLDNLRIQVHSNIDSMVQSCPRLSLLSYRKLRLALKIWNLGFRANSSEADFIASCVQNMFAGVGELTPKLDDSENAEVGSIICVGFQSSDTLEQVDFPEPVSFRETLDTFIDQFSMSLRKTLMRSMDVFAVARLSGLRSLVLNLMPTDLAVPETLRVIFKQRTQRLHNLAHDGHPSQCLTLFNQVIFCEDVSLCLGRPVGAMERLRSDINPLTNPPLRARVASKWRSNLHSLIEVMNQNVADLLEAQPTISVIGTSQDNFKSRGIPQVVRNGDLSARKATGLVSCLVRQEITWINIVQKLVDAPSLESAWELWTGMYKLHYIYSPEDRQKKNSALEVSISGISVTHGMEYYGAKLPVLESSELDKAVRSTIVAGLRGRGCVLVSQDNCEAPLQSNGDYSVRGGDIAMALGRVFTSLTNVQAENTLGVHIFLSRVVFLRAVGYVDFVGMSSPALNCFETGLEQMWDALCKKDKFHAQGGLRFPFPVGRALGAKALSRSMRCSEILGSILHYSQDSASEELGVSSIFQEPPMLVVGVLSENDTGDSSVFHHVCRSLLDVVSIPNIQAIDQLGLLCSSRGLVFGSSIQAIAKRLLEVLDKRFGHRIPISTTRLTTSALWEGVASKLEKTMLYDDTLNREEGLPLSIGLTPKRFVREVETFFAMMWEDLLLGGDFREVGMETFRSTVAKALQPLVDDVLVQMDPAHPRYRKMKAVPETPRLDMGQSLGHNAPSVPRRARVSVFKAAHSLGHKVTGDFLQTTINLWDILCRSNTTAVVLSGGVATGKTAVRQTALTGIAQSGIMLDVMHSGSPWLSHVRGIFLIKRFVSRWRSMRGRGKEQMASSGQGGHSSNDITGRAALPVKLCVIHHRALTLHQLIGGIDESGHWEDGVLVRKLRGDDDTETPSEDKSAHVFIPHLEAVVLDGPIDHAVEGLFCGTWSYTSRPSCLDTNNQRRLVFPSGELGMLRPSLKVILETSDRSNASPAFLTRVQSVHLTTSARLIARRAVISWLDKINAWLGRFPAWQDVIAVVKHVVIKDDKFYMKLLDIDRRELKGRLVVSTMVSRLSSFLHLLESLLQDCHVLALEDAAVVRKINGKPMDKANPLILGISERNVLLKRVRLSIMYAALWGFGGSYNGTSKCKKFRDILSACLDGFFQEQWTMETGFFRSPFECKLDLRTAKFVRAMHVLDDDADMDEMFGDDTFAVAVAAPMHNGGMVLTTPLLEAIRFNIKSLLGTGLRIVISGEGCAGKSTLLNTVMAEVGAGVPNTENTRSFTRASVNELLERNKSVSVQGMPGIILGLAEQMKNVRHEAEEGRLGLPGSMLEVAMDLLGLPKRQYVNYKQHLKHATFHPLTTSLRAKTTATALHDWLVRELATPDKDTLHAPINSVATVFLDDLHVAARASDGSDETIGDGEASSGDNGGRGREVMDVYDDVMSLIKGLADDIRFSSIGHMRHVHAPPIHEAPDFFPVEPFSRPLLQKGHMSENKDNHYICDPVAIVGTMSMSLDSMVLEQGGRLNALIPRFSCLHVPSMNRNTLHNALVTGICHGLREDIASDCRDALLEITKCLIEIDQSAVSSEDRNLTVPIERSLRQFVGLDVSHVAHFCEVIKLARRNITNVETLLRCVVHDWKRLFIDPLPSGYQRERYTGLMSMKLAKLHPEKFDVNESVVDFLFRELADDDFEPRGIWIPLKDHVLGAVHVADPDEVYGVGGRFAIGGGGDEGAAAVPDETSDTMTHVTTAVDMTEAGGAGDAKLSSDAPNKECIYRPVLLSTQQDREMYYCDEDRQRFALGQGTLKRPSKQELMVDTTAVWSLGGPPITPGPKIVNRLLRLARCMMRSRPILVPTFAGVDAASMAGVAALFTGFIPMRFNCWKRQGEPNVVAAPSAHEGMRDDRYNAMGAAPSDQSLLAQDARYFMKRCVLRAAGLHEKFVDLPPSQAYRLRTETSYEKIEAEPTLAILSGLQEMPHTNRSELVRFMENGDPTCFFSDFELIAIDLCVHEADVKAHHMTEMETMQAAQLKYNHDEALSAGTKPKDNPDDEADNDDDNATIASGVTSLDMNVVDLDGQAPAFGNVFPSSIPPPGPPLMESDMLVAEPGDGNPGMNASVSGSADDKYENPSILKRVRPPPSRPDGQARSNVRAFLVEQCKRHLRLLCTVDYPRSLYLEAIDESARQSRDAMALLQKSGRRTDTASMMGHTVENEPSNEQIKPRGSKVPIASASPVGGGGRGAKSRRFSMINAKVQQERGAKMDIQRELDAVGAHIVKNEEARTPPEAESKTSEAGMRKTRRDNHSILMGDGGKFAGGAKGMTEKERQQYLEKVGGLTLEEFGAATAADEEENTEDWYIALQNDAVLSTHPDVLQCPLLGPMLRKFFDCIWLADSEGLSVDMICHAYLREKSVLERAEGEGDEDHETGGLNMDYTCTFSLTVPSQTIQARQAPHRAALDSETGRNMGGDGDDDSDDGGNPWGGDPPFDTRPLAEQTGVGRIRLEEGSTSETLVEENAGVSKEVAVRILTQPSVGAARALHALFALGSFSSAHKDLNPATPPRTTTDELKSSPDSAAISASIATTTAESPDDRTTQEASAVHESDSTVAAAVAAENTGENAVNAAASGGGDGDTEMAAHPAPEAPSGPVLYPQMGVYAKVSAAVEDEFIRADFAERELLMRKEALQILPALLTVPCPSDACLLERSTFLVGPEEAAHRAARLVCLAIHEVVASLERRRVQLSVAKKELERAMGLITRVESLCEACDRRAEALDADTAVATMALNKLTVQLNDLDVWAMSTVEAEQQQMLREDMSATRRERCDPVIPDGRLQAAVEPLSRSKLKPMHTFASVFQVTIKDPALLALVRGIILVIDFKPKQRSSLRRNSSKVGGNRRESKKGSMVRMRKSDNGTSSDGSDTETNNGKRLGNKGVQAKAADTYEEKEELPNPILQSDAELCQYAFALFNSKDLLKRLIEVSPRTIVHSGPRYRDMLLVRDELESLDPSSSEYITEDRSVVDLVHAMVNFYLAFVARMEFADIQGRRFVEIELMDEQRDSLRTSYQRERKIRGLQLDDAQAEAVQHLQMCEKYASLCRSKGALLRGLRERNADMLPQLRASLAFVSDEYIEAVETRRTVVADICISACVLHRSGWMPEHVRAEVHDVMRNLLGSTVPVSPGPFILGNLLDRRQIRKWTPDVHRDIGTINTLSLVHFNTDYAYIIDPDCSAVDTLLHSCPTGYSPISVKGAAFNFLDFEQAVKEAERADKTGCFLVLTDLQAGVSADLVTLLCSQLHRRHTRDGDTTKTELYAEVSGLGDEDCLMQSYGHVHLMPLRLIMVGTVAPTVDLGGQGNPLPVAAMQRVTVIQWTLGATHGVYVEAKPINNCANQTFVPDGALEAEMTAYIMKNVSPTHMSDIQDVNARILQKQDAIYELENRIVRACWIMYCAQRHEKRIAFGVDAEARSHQKDEDGDEEDMEHMDLGVLTDPGSLDCMQITMQERIHSSRELMNLQQQERDLLAYQTVIRELLFMTSRLSRMCSYIIPSPLLPPYALSSRALSRKAIEPMIKQNKNVFDCVPSDLHKMRRYSRAIRRVQGNFRRWKYGIVTHGDVRRWLNDDSDKGKPSGGHKTDPVAKLTPAERSRRATVRRTKRLRTKLDSLMTMEQHERTQCMTDMAFLTRGLRKTLLKGLVSYLRENIRPGYEWLVKFSLVLTSWCTSAKPIPTGDLRFMVHNMLGSLELPQPRFAFDTGLYFDSIDKRPDRLYAIKHNMSGNEAATTSARRKSSVIRRQSVNAAPTGLVVSLNVASVDGGSVDAYTRQTLLNKQGKRDDQKLRLQEERSQELSVVGAAKTNSKSAGLPPGWRDMAWRHQGPGVMDGIWLSSSGVRWAIASVSHARIVNSTFEDSEGMQMAFDWNCTFLDTISNATITVKNPMFIPAPRGVDSFELEYLQAHGVRVFSLLPVLPTGDRQPVQMPRTRRSVRRLNGKGLRTENMNLLNVAVVPNLATGSHTALNPLHVVDISGNGEDTAHNDDNNIDGGAPSDSDGHPSEKNRNFRLMGTVILRDEDGDETNALVKLSQKLQLASKTLSMKVKFQRLFGNSRVQHYLATMERHSNSRGVFSGLSEGIIHSLSRFGEWKAALDALRRQNLSDLYEEQLSQLVDSIVPPNLSDDVPEEMNDPNAGLWVDGKELTVMQTLMLTAVLVPSAIAGVVELYSTLLANYLSKGGIISLHAGEDFDHAPLDDDSSDSDSSSSDLTEEDTGDSESSEEEEEDNFDGGELRKTTYKSAYREAARALRKCQDTAHFNAWESLKRIVLGLDDVKKPLMAVRHGNTSTTASSKSMLTPRDYDDWEGSMLELLSVDSAANRSSCLHDMLTTMHRGEVRVMLTPNLPGLEVNTAGWLRSMATLASITQKPLQYVKFPLQDLPVRPSMTCAPALHLGYKHSASVASKSIEHIAAAMATLIKKPGTKVQTVKPISTFTEMLILENHGAIPYIHTLLDGVAAIEKQQEAQFVQYRKEVHMKRRELMEQGRDQRLAESLVEPIVEPTGGHVVLATKCMAQLTDDFDAGLPAATGDLIFTWLPRLAATDLVANSNNPTALTDVSTPEASDALTLELERALLLVKHTATLAGAQGVPLIADLHVNSSAHCNDDEHEFILRLTALVSVLWSFHMFLKCTDRDQEGKAGLWSLCTVPMGLWETSCIVNRLISIIDVDWIADLNEYTVQHVEYNPAPTYTQKDKEGSPRATRDLNFLMESPEFITLTQRLVEVLIDPGSKADYPEMSGRQRHEMQIRRRDHSVKKGHSRVNVIHRNSKQGGSQIGTHSRHGSTAGTGATTGGNPNKRQSTHSETLGSSVAEAHQKKSEDAEGRSEQVLSPNASLRRLRPSTTALTASASPPPTGSSPLHSTVTTTAPAKTSATESAADSVVALVAAETPPSPHPPAATDTRGQQDSRKPHKRPGGAAKKKAHKAAYTPFNLKEERVKHIKLVQERLHEAADHRRLCTDMTASEKLYITDSTPAGRDVMGSMGYFLAKIILSERFKASRHIRSTTSSSRSKKDSRMALFALDTKHDKTEPMINVVPKVDLSMGSLLAPDMAGHVIKWILR